MKRNFLFLILTLFIGNLSVSAAKESQGISYYKAGFPLVAKPLLINELTADVSTKAETCFYLGNIYFSENKNDSAEIYFKKGIVTGDDNVLSTIGLSMLKIKSNQKEADLDIQNVLKLRSAKKNQDFIIAAANAYLVNGLIDQAVIYQDKAKEIKSKYAPLAVLEGDIQLAKKDVGNACSNYELAILYDPNCKEAYVKYARAYKNVNTTLAIEKLNQLKLKEPSFLLVDKELADIYYSNNEFDKAATFYESYLKSGNSNAQDLVKYAMTLFLNHKFAESLEIANKGLQKEPRNPAFNRLAMYNNTDLKQYDEAIKSADLLFNKSDKADFTYLDYRYYGMALHETKQIPLAIEQYKKAIDADSSHVELWKDISDMYTDINDFDNAISSYNKYVSALPEDKKTSDMYYDLGKMYYSVGSSAAKDTISKGGKTENFVLLKKNALLKADSIFAKVITMEPTNYRGYRMRALANLALDPDATQGLANPYYEKTLAIVEAKNDQRYNPIIIESERYLGYYYYQKKDYTQAKVYFNKVLVIEPTNDIALKVIAGIDKILKGKK
jgi:tetratricopeptide (TPR) repeat protein